MASATELERVTASGGVNVPPAGENVGVAAVPAGMSYFRARYVSTALRSESDSGASYTISSARSPNHHVLSPRSWPKLAALTGPVVTRDRTAICFGRGVARPSTREPLR